MEKKGYIVTGQFPMRFQTMDTCVLLFSTRVNRREYSSYLITTPPCLLSVLGERGCFFGFAAVQIKGNNTQELRLEDWN